MNLLKQVFPETSVHYEVGDHEVLEQDSEMEPYHLCDASKVNVACEEALSVKEDGFAHADVAACGSSRTVARGFGD
jgi:hypothetical protein